MPEEISFSLAHPPGFEHLDQRECHGGYAPQNSFADLLRDEIRKIETLSAQHRARTGTTVLGMKAVLKQRVGDRPRSREPRRRLSPRVACRNTWRRIEALMRNRHFVAAYRAARALFIAGADAIFPAGCYWLRRFAGVACEPLPPAPG
jgi:hypothetical protein